ncbi:MAG TPA: hypothetical protein VFC54_12855 [Pseudolabrys sp.]|nr:hypothetical protein [Pseudolabrys sp.]
MAPLVAKQSLSAIFEKPARHHVKFIEILAKAADAGIGTSGRTGSCFIEARQGPQKPSRKRGNLTPMQNSHT